MFRQAQAWYPELRFVSSWPWGGDSASKAAGARGTQLPAVHRAWEGQPPAAHLDTWSIMLGGCESPRKEPSSPQGTLACRPRPAFHSHNQHHIIPGASPKCSQVVSFSLLSGLPFPLPQASAWPNWFLPPSAPSPFLPFLESAYWLLTHTRADSWAPLCLSTK